MESVPPVRCISSPSGTTSVFHPPTAMQYKIQEARFERAADATVRTAAGAARRLEDLQSQSVDAPASLLPELQVGTLLPSLA